MVFRVFREVVFFYSDKGNGKEEKEKVGRVEFGLIINKVYKYFKSNSLTRSKGAILHHDPVMRGVTYQEDNTNDG